MIIWQSGYAHTLHVSHKQVSVCCLAVEYKKMKTKKPDYRLTNATILVHSFVRIKTTIRMIRQTALFC